MSIENLKEKAFQVSRTCAQCFCVTYNMLISIKYVHIIENSVNFIPSDQSDESQTSFYAIT